MAYAFTHMRNQKSSKNGGNWRKFAEFARIWQNMAKLCKFDRFGEGGGHIE